MINVKTIIIIITSTIFSLNAKAQECSYLWDAEIFGIKVGKMKDTIEKSSNQIKITSLFTPEGIVKSFGAPGIKRTILFDKNMEVTERTEEHIGKNKYFELKNIENHFHEVQNGKTLNTFEIKEKLSIDGTSAPYIYYIFKSDLIKSETKFNVLNKNKVIYSKIQVNPNKILFKEGIWSVDIDMTSQKEPEKITINDGNNTLVATIIEKKCSK